ncbi:hypothetical protein Droror1_Dr00001265 [Drosera rotundifolia]
MTSPAAAAPPPKSIDAGLWFPSFSLLYKDLENLPVGSPPPPSLTERIRESRDWFLDTVNGFKGKSGRAREAVEAAGFVVGRREVVVEEKRRALALKLSDLVCLDEVQSYILVERSMERSPVFDGVNQGYLQELVLQYYIERQCLLKCTRLLISNALYMSSDVTAGKENTVQDEAFRLISQGFENKLISTLEELLSSRQPQEMDLDLFILWAEETLTEDNLVLDMLFLLYYESFCTCRAATWKTLCLLYKGMISGSYNLGKLRASDEAVKYIYQAKVQMLFILMEALDFENLLQMIQNEIPLRDGSKYSSSSIQEMDAVISSFDVLEMREAGPLVLAWAVFLCLVLSLPRKEDNLDLMEIDHACYVRLSFEVESLGYFLEVIRSDVLKGSDGPTSGYRSILRTFISSFIASYEISIQPEDGTLKSILTLLGEIYKGEEELCVQFWDRDSIVDGPIRCLLCSLEGEFPYRTIDLISLLSALCEGSWPAECVYNFLDKSVGLSSLLEINNDILIDEDSQTVLTNATLVIPGVEGLMIPSKTRGHVLRMVGDGTALVRWEHIESGMFVLALRLAQNRNLYNSEEVVVFLDLLSRLVSFNMGICHVIMNLNSSLDLPPSDGYEHTQRKIQIDVVEVLCNVVRNLTPSFSNISAVALGVSILTRMLKCSPSHVSMMVAKADLFDLSPKTSFVSLSIGGISSSSSLATGKLAKMFLIDVEQNLFCPFTISVLDFSIGLLEAGVEDDGVLPTIIFCLQYVLVNHEYWNYKSKQDRWLVTLKVLGVLKMSILSIPYLTKIGSVIGNIVLSDSSIHNTLFRIVCVTSESLERLYFSRLHNMREIEGLHSAICSVLDILSVIHSILWKDDVANVPLLYQEMLSPTTKPIPLVAALISLLAYVQSPAIQVGAARVLSMMFTVADNSWQFLSATAIFGLGHKQVLRLRNAIENTILEKTIENEDLFVATVKLMTAAAHFQPTFLSATFTGAATTELQMKASNTKDQAGKISFWPLTSKNANFLIDMVLTSLERYKSLVNSNPQALASILDFLKALWQQASQYADLLKAITSSRKFWENLSGCILSISGMEVPSPSNLSEADARSIACNYRCQSTAFDIFSLVMFLRKKLLHAEVLTKQASQFSSGSIGDSIDSQKLESLNLQHVKDILLSWSNSSEFNKLVKLASATVFDAEIYHHAKVASSVLSTHLIVKIISGDAGSLSATFIENLHALFNKLTNVPAFADLFSQYSQHGYSAGTELRSLIISDLHYHLEGELVGRGIESGPFKELAQFLADSDLFQRYKRHDDDFLLDGNDVFAFDLERLRQDMGLDTWTHSAWKASVKLADSLLIHLQNVNSMMIQLASRIASLRAFIMVLSLNESTGERINTPSQAHEDIVSSCIAYVCQELGAMVGLILAASDAPLAVLSFLAAQAELFLCLLRNMHGKMSLDIFKLLSKTCSFSLKALSESKSLSGEVNSTMKFMLIVQLLAMENILNRDPVVGVSDSENDGTLGEVSNTCLAILPILCNCSVIPDLHILSLMTIDLILGRCLVPSTWFPVIQEHLQMQHIMMSLQDERYSNSISEILKFLLTLARVRGGAEMVLASGFVSSLKLLFADTSYANSYTAHALVKPPSDVDVEKPCHIWGLGVTVLTAIVYSLGGSPHVIDVLDSVVPFFFLEKAYLITDYINAPDFPIDRHDKSRAWFQNRQTSLSGLRETEHTLPLICVLANHRNYWTKALKGVESDLRERSIHLLAFISRGSHSIGESPAQTIPLLCPPSNKEEIDCCKKAAFVNSKKGWFSLTPLGCSQQADVSSDSIKSTAIVLKDPSSRSVAAVAPTHFSDTVAIQIYRTAFLLLKFLCLQADNAARKTEELGFVDLSHFPELPMPDILHGLQDQAIAIVGEICGASKSRQMTRENQSLCLLLLQAAEMSLYLELCVSQICGIRTVLGRVEDFSKEIKSFFRATEGHAFLRQSIKDLKQVISSVYPGLLQSEGIW